MRGNRLRRTLAAIMSAVLIWVTGFVALVPVYAESENDFDNTAVLDDLTDLDLTEFPANASGAPALLRFVEYCYSDDPSARTNYGLYVYVYNPSRLTFSTREGANELNIATSYGADGEPDDYESLPMKYCGTSTGTYSKLFYKFRVLNVEKVLENAVAHSKQSGERRYDVAGVQLWEEGKVNAEDYGISRKYFFSGFAKGYSEESTDRSTLSCRYNKLETVDLTVYHTNYRMSEECKAYTRQEVNSVYFAVPQHFFDDYGALQKIKAKWYEYKTTPVFVTSDSGALAALEPYIGVNIGEKDEGLKWRVLWEETKDTRPATGGGLDYLYYFAKDFNRKNGDRESFLSEKYYFTGIPLPRFDWLFDTDGGSYKGYQVPRERVIEYIENYTAARPLSNKVQGKYAADLFAESIDEERVKLLVDPSAKRGQIIQEIDAGEKINLFEYGEQSWWEKFIGRQPESEVTKTESPIAIVSPGDLNLSESSFCEKYLVNKADYEAVKSFCKTTLNQTGEAAAKPVIFHFARTDYYSSAARYDLVADFGESGYTLSDPDGYVAQETVFLDFDIITLTFRRGEKEKVIACVSSPIDIINGFDPPTSGLPFETKGSGCDVVQKIFSVVVLAFCLFLIWKVLVWLIDKIFKKDKK